MKIEKEKFIEVINSSKTMAEAARNLNIHYKTLKSYAQQLGVFNPNQSGKGTQKYQTKIEDILSNKIEINRSNLKSRLIKEKILKYECNICRNNGSWNNKSLSLELHHKNGISNDNSLDNLQFLCPNCHSIRK